MRLTTLLLLLFVLPAGGRNILENPSFEVQEERNSALPEHWSVIKRGSFEPTHRLEETLALDGKHAARIDNRNPSCEKASLLWMQANLGAKLKKFQPGTKIEYSVYAFAVDSPATARMYFESLAAKKCFLKTEKLSPGKWKKISGTFTLEDLDYGTPYVCLQLIGNGSVVFDRAYLGPVQSSSEPEVIVPPDANRVRNGGAEKLDAKTGLPEFWKVLRRGKIGAGRADTAIVSRDAHSFLLEADGKPDGMLAWDCRLDAEDLAGLKPGDEMILSFDANTRGDPSVTFRFYIEFMQKGKFIGTFISNPESVYAGWVRKTLRFKMPKESPASAHIYIQLLTAGRLNIDDVTLLPAAGAPASPAEQAAGDYCRTTGFPPRHTYIRPACPGKLKLEFFLPQPVLKVSLSEIDGKPLKVWEFDKLPVRKSGQVELELPPLANGAYELAYESGGLTDFDLFRIRDKQLRGVSFRDDHVMLLNGKPFFPIGICTPSNELDALRVYSQSGINFITAGVSGGERAAAYTFETLGKYNLAVVDWNNYGLRASVSDEKLRRSFQEINTCLEKHNNFIGFMSDEASWNNFPLESVQRDYKFIFKYCPDSIAWLNNAPRLTGSADDPRQSFDSVRRYSRAADVTGVDIYPVPGGRHNNLPNKTLSCVGDYTELSRKLIWDEKPVWMILQAFSWSEEWSGKVTGQNPRPTRHELRFMVWDAVVRGARGIVWYGKGAQDVYSDFWRSVADVSRELSAVAEWIMNDARPASAPLPGAPSKVKTLIGADFMILVNEDSEKTAEFFVKLPKTFYETPSGKEFTDPKISLKPLDVLILTSKPVVIPPTERFTPRETAEQSNSHGIYRKKVLLSGEWVAHPEYLRGPEKTVFLKHDFTLPARPRSAALRISVDDYAKVSVNGIPFVEECSSHRTVSEYQIAEKLKAGKNILEIAVTNVSGPTGIVFELNADGKIIRSGEDTFFSMNGKDSWKKAHVFGKPPVKPWGEPNIFMEKK
ncbi:MAG: hypothetical protein BWY31_00765 [Lentisphaerae bacterium ADurb.Bin242]|nr:MAG: hypothetical protein BWY31_00765 [Lentisphaerae bacterium ADurb.Bin242]